MVRETNIGRLSEVLITAISKAVAGRSNLVSSSFDTTTTHKMAMGTFEDLNVPDAVIEHLQELVSSNYLDTDTAAMHIRASALIARLKALNRNANAATRVHKQATAEARQEMDQTHLGLQNLLYEKRHLEREIEKCRQFA